MQHLVDIICSNTAPSSQDCLGQLTKWLNLLLSGKAHPLLAPWICGGQLTALLKPNNRGYRPIAVGDSFRRLVSGLCCSAVYHQLPDLLIPRGQLGVAVKGGLEAVIHSTRPAINHLQDEEDMCILKVDFQCVQ